MHVLYLLLLLVHFSAAIPLKDFYPFGVNATDKKLSSNDDGSSDSIQLSVVFPFFGINHTTVFVSNCMI